MFTVEDGTGLAGANSYIDLTFADTYHEDRQNLSWSAATQAIRQGALIRASEYVDKRFGLRFKGFKSSSTQGLEWPRIGALDADDYLLNGVDDVPRQLQKAVAEYGLRALTLSELAPDNTDVGVNATETKIGPIVIKNELRNFAATGTVSPSSIPDYPEADLWIQELLTSLRNNKLVRG